MFHFNDILSIFFPDPPYHLFGFQTVELLLSFVLSSSGDFLREPLVNEIVDAIDSVEASLGITSTATNAFISAVSPFSSLRVRPVLDAISNSRSAEGLALLVRLLDSIQTTEVGWGSSEVEVVRLKSFAALTVEIATNSSRSELRGSLNNIFREVRALHDNMKRYLHQVSSMLTAFRMCLPFIMQVAAMYTQRRARALLRNGLEAGFDAALALTRRPRPALDDRI